MSTGFVFPGQGSQAVGMGRALAEAFGPARLVFEEIDDALGQRLSRLIFEGPEQELTLTENAQPALMAVSLAAVRVLESDGGFRLADKAAFVAGHSLGEYSALAASGALSLADAARLLKRRGRAMQLAVPVGEGAMAALLGLDLPAAEEVAAAAAQGEVCSCANDNGPGQVVVSGHRAAVERAITIAGEKGAKRSILLPVSAPFHCALMEPVKARLAEVLARCTISAPAIPVVTNVEARPNTDAARVVPLLLEQVSAPVRWLETIRFLHGAGVTRMVELGPGRVLSGLVKRIAKDVEVLNVEDPTSLGKALGG